MSWMNNKVSSMSQGARIVTAAALLALGAAGGASATQLTRPAIEMAPTTPTPTAKLADGDNLVAVKGRVAEIYGDNVVVEDATGRVLVNLGPESASAITKGSTISAQGRFDNGQLHASFLTTADGKVVATGPRGPHGRHPGPHDHGGPELAGAPPCLAPPSLESGIASPMPASAPQASR